MTENRPICVRLRDGETLTIHGACRWEVDVTSALHLYDDGGVEVATFACGQWEVVGFTEALRQ